MLVRIALGSEIDVATGDELAQGFDEVKGLLNRPESKPIHTTRVMSSVTDAANRAQLNFGQPAVGKLWNVLGLVLFGSDDRTVVAGTTGVLYFGDGTNPSLTGIRAVGLAIPSSLSFNDNVYWVHSSDEVFVNVYGAAPGVAVGGILIFAEWDTQAKEVRGI